MKVMVIPIVISVLSTVTKGLIKGLEELKIRGRVKKIPTTALLRSASILRKVLETLGDLLSLGLHLETTANVGVKNSHNNNNHNGGHTSCNCALFTIPKRLVK